MTETLLLPQMVRALVEPRLPAGLDVHWFGTQEEGLTLGPKATIGWLDILPPNLAPPIIESATSLKWLQTLFAGLDHMPVDVLRGRNVTLTNGVGLSTTPVADYAVMGVLTLAKRFADVVRAHDRQEWLAWPSPGISELDGASALIIGMGAIGNAIADRLRPFGVQVTGVRRTPAPDMLTPDSWRAKLGEFDIVIVAAPGTPDTRHMLGREEFAAMKPNASLVNIGRGSLIDQMALVDALEKGTPGAAFLDVTDPEPLPSDHPLWRAKNAMVTMHLSGRSQTRTMHRAADLFLDNLDRYLSGQPLRNVADLSLGY